MVNLKLMEHLKTALLIFLSKLIYFFHLVTSVRVSFYKSFFYFNMIFLKSIC